MKCKKHRIGNFSIIRNDSFNLKPEQLEALKNINTYFYDGGHYEWQHEKALTYYYKNLANVFIFIVDDWAHEPAVKGTRKALKDLNFGYFLSFLSGKYQLLGSYLEDLLGRRWTYAEYC